MKPYRKIKALVSSLLLFGSILAWGVSPCDLSLLTFKERYAQTYPTTWSVLNKLEVFAEKNKLPVLKSTSDLYAEEHLNDIFLIKTHYENNYLSEGRKIHLLAFTLPKNRIIEDEISKYLGRK